MNFYSKIFILLFFIFSFSLFGQKPDSTAEKNIAKNSIFVEILGNACNLASINYDRIIFQSKNINLSVATGIGMFPLTDKYLEPNKIYFAYGIPFSVNLLWGKRNHFLEVGLGLTYSKGAKTQFAQTSSTNPTTNVTTKDVTVTFSELIFFIPRIGYRFQKNKHGFFFRVGFTPLITIKDYTPKFTSSLPYRISPFIPMGGISLGYSFK